MSNAEVVPEKAAQEQATEAKGEESSEGEEITTKAPKQKLNKKQKAALLAAAQQPQKGQQKKQQPQKTVQQKQKAEKEKQKELERKKEKELEEQKKKIEILLPPPIPEGELTITQLFPSGHYPEGEVCLYAGNNLWRSDSQEKKESEKIHYDSYESIRKAAEVHRRVRKDAQSWIKPGMKMIDICKRLEAMNKYMVEASGLERGIAFPTGCSINHCAAHYTPNTGDDTILGINDVVKFDFGTHVNGYIVDCAWTMHWNPQYDNLVKAVKDATNTGIREAGIDVRVNDIGAAIQEVMESYECEINGKTFPIKSIRNLTGHSIDPYVIHAGKSVPIVKGDNDNSKMEEGEFYAIETFGSTGRGKVNEEGECSHYMKSKDAPFQQIRMAKTAQLFKYIGQKYSTLAFCRRWLDEDGQDQNAGSLRQLVNLGLITQHPPLCDVVGSYTAQFEHTILLRPTCKEVISRGLDY